MAFKIIRNNCCGLDVHKTWIYACIGITDPNGRTEYKQALLLFFQRTRRSGCLDLLYTLPGLDKNPMTAIAILSEIGPDMSVFPSSKHLVSWAGRCPRNDQSSHKVKSTRISRAGSYLKPLLVQIANAVIRSKKHPEFRERYNRIKSHRGHKKPSSPFARCS